MATYHANIEFRAAVIAELRALDRFETWFVPYDRIFAAQEGSIASWTRNIHAATGYTFRMLKFPEGILFVQTRPLVPAEVTTDDNSKQLRPPAKGRPALPDTPGVRRHYSAFAR